MKFLAVGTIALAAAFRVNGQVFPPDFTSMPSCAFTPLTNAVAVTGCVTTDVACFCSAGAFATTITGQVSAGCSAADRTEAYRIIMDLCSLNGAPINLGSGAATTTTAPPPPATTTTVPPQSSATTSSAPTTGTRSSTSGSGNAGPSTTGSVPSPRPSTATGSAAPESTYTGGGPHVRPNWVFKDWRGSSSSCSSSHGR